MHPAGGCAAAPPGRSGQDNAPDSADPLPLRSHCCCTAGGAGGGGMGGARVDGGGPTTGRQREREVGERSDLPCLNWPSALQNQLYGGKAGS